jgi:uncharacterized NAD-dependent epimerase/dehydratase family protein
MGSSVGRRYLILTDDLNNVASKTAQGVLRYGHDDVVAVIDAANAGKRVSDLLPSVRHDAPILENFSEAASLGASSLLIGVAPDGGTLPSTFRSAILAAIDAGMEIVSGLHELLKNDTEFVTHAKRSGARLWDVRVPTEVPKIFSGRAYRVPQTVVLTVGSDCAVGKMTATLEIERAAKRAHVNAQFVATGQTGILIAGKGIAVDHVISDFVAGAAEELVCDVPAEVSHTLVEGQGSIFHPAYAPVTFGLILGSAPDLLVLCHEAGRTSINGFPEARIPSLSDLIEAHATYLAMVKPAPTVAIILNTVSLSAKDARAEIAKAEAETGLPADDPVRFGGDRIWAAIDSAAHLVKKGNVLAKGLSS